MSAATLNGRPRKQLADQLDRLDTIIDTLSAGLNGAVADACREGTRQAVTAALVEVLTNPDLRALLLPSAPAPTPAPAPTAASKPRPPGLWSRLKTKVTNTIRAVRTTVTESVATVRAAVAVRVLGATNVAAALSAATGEALPVRRTLAVAAGAGLFVWAACHLLPESAAAALAGTGWALTTAFVQAGAWLRRAARRFGVIA